jgi:hypothetical protein
VKNRDILPLNVDKSGQDLSGFLILGAKPAKGERSVLRSAGSVYFPA